MSRKRRKHKKTMQLWQQRAYMWRDAAEAESQRAALAHFTIERVLERGEPLTEDDTRRLSIFLAKPELELRRLIMGIEAMVIQEMIDSMIEHATAWRNQHKMPGASPAGPLWVTTTNNTSGPAPLSSEAYVGLFAELNDLLRTYKHRRENLHLKAVDREFGPAASAYWEDPETPDLPWGWEQAVGEPGDEEPETPA